MIYITGSLSAEWSQLEDQTKNDEYQATKNEIRESKTKVKNDEFSIS